MKAKGYFGGIDPGLDGGFAVISGNQIHCKFAMPLITTTTKKGKIKKELDRDGIFSFLLRIPPYTHVVIEEQIPVRNQHIQASHTLAKNYGILLMALTAARIHTTEVPSGIWQDHFGIVSVKKGEGETTKVQAFRICRLHYPYGNFRKSERAFKPHDGIVDAVLIANYCQALYAPTYELIEPLEVKPFTSVIERRFL
jgi:Holliday junction resolvasome RuvABC endonuclease subunit